MKSLTISALALLVFTLPAAAEENKITGQFGWIAFGHNLELEKDHVLWTGEFSGTFFNDKGKDSPFHEAGVRCPGTYDLNFGKKQGHANGFCIVMGPGSSGVDQAFLKWACDGDTVNCTGTFEYTGGSGKYQSASGTNTFRAMSTGVWRDGNISGFAIWNR